ncbi:ADCY10, partial [Symbiodinium necroappetens]
MPRLANVTLDKLDDSVKNWLNDQNTQTLNGALAFVPFILQQAFFEGNLDEKQIVIHKGSGGVVFSDASGFTALTEKLAKKSNGAELLSQCLTAFFTPLIDLINAYRGDTIKFSGDALTIYFPSVDDTKTSSFNGIVPPHGSFGLADLGPMATAVLRASACCIEIHKRLHMFETGVDDVRLCLHIGVGCGEISILQVGGIVPPETHIPRIEYLISGAPLEQISIAEPLAKNGETCLSPQAWELVKDCVIEGRPLEDRMDFHLLLRMDESKYTFPTIKYATQLYDTRIENCFKLDQLNITRRYIPSAVFKQIECGTLQYVNEMRVLAEHLWWTFPCNISVIFINGSGLDVMSSNGPSQAQELMSSVQKVCYAHEGTLNKFLIDDKGMQRPQHLRPAASIMLFS